jgi:hypothetical protein
MKNEISKKKRKKKKEFAIRVARSNKKGQIWPVAVRKKAKYPTGK